MAERGSITIVLSEKKAYSRKDLLIIGRGVDWRFHDRLCDHRLRLFRRHAALNEIEKMGDARVWISELLTRAQQMELLQRVL